MRSLCLWLFLLSITLVVGCEDSDDNTPAVSSTATESAESGAVTEPAPTRTPKRVLKQASSPSQSPSPSPEPTSTSTPGPLTAPSPPAPTFTGTWTLTFTPTLTPTVTPQPTLPDCPGLEKEREIILRVTETLGFFQRNGTSGRCLPDGVVAGWQEVGSQRHKIRNYGFSIRRYDAESEAASVLAEGFQYIPATAFHDCTAHVADNRHTDSSISWQVSRWVFSVGGYDDSESFLNRTGFKIAELMFEAAAEEGLLCGTVPPTPTRTLRRIVVTPTPTAAPGILPPTPIAAASPTALWTSQLGPAQAELDDPVFQELDIALVRSLLDGLAVVFGGLGFRHSLSHWDVDVHG